MIDLATTALDNRIGEFGEACDEITDLLLRSSGMEHWLVTRTTRETQRILSSAGSAFVFRRSTELSFNDSLCARMIDGAPRWASSVPQSPVYSDCPMALRHGVGSYVGAVIFDADGSVFGTLAGFDTRRHLDVPDGLDRQVQLHGALLTLRLAEVRGAERPHLPSPSIDDVTGFASPDLWPDLRRSLEMECRILGDEATVVTVRLKGLDALANREGRAARDEAIREVAYVLRTEISGVFARLDEESFVAVARNVRVMDEPMRRSLTAIGLEYDLRCGLHATSRCWTDSDALEAAEQRAWAASAKWSRSEVVPR